MEVEDFSATDIKYHSCFGRIHVTTLARLSLLLTASIAVSLAVLQASLTSEWGALFVVPLALFGALAVFSEFRMALVAYAVINVIFTLAFTIIHMITRLIQAGQLGLEEGDCQIIIALYCIFLASMLIAPTWSYFNLTKFIKDRESLQQLISSLEEE